MHWKSRIWIIIIMVSRKHRCIWLQPPLIYNIPRRIYSKYHRHSRFSSQLPKIVPWISCIDVALPPPDATSPLAMMVHTHRICAAIGAIHFKMSGHPPRTMLIRITTIIPVPCIKIECISRTMCQFKLESSIRAFYWISCKQTHGQSARVPFANVILLLLLFHICFYSFPPVQCFQSRSLVSMILAQLIQTKPKITRHCWIWPNVLVKQNHVDWHDPKSINFQATNLIQKPIPVKLKFQRKLSKSWALFTLSSIINVSFCQWLLF